LSVKEAPEYLKVVIKYSTHNLISDDVSYRAWNLSMGKIW